MNAMEQKEHSANATIIGELAPDDSALTIAIAGVFTSAAMEAFRACYEPLYESSVPKDEMAGEKASAQGSLSSTARHFIIEMSETIEVDAGGMGLLLLLREYLGDRALSIEIRNCSPEVAQTMNIPTMQNRFTFSP